MQPDAKKTITSLLFFLVIIMFPVSSVFACFAVVVGKDASSDGSVIFGHLEQNGGLRNMSYFFVPRMEHKPGSVVELRRGGTYPQVPVTYSYLWGKNTGVEFGDGYFNEWGVAIASDATPTRENSYEELVARGDITDGGIGYKLRRIVAQRARTAREGVEIAGDLLDRFGYATTGRTYVIADADEAWVLAVAKGKTWIAQRVPDNEIVLLPNVHIIGPEADLADTENVIASKGLIEYASLRDWYDPASGEPFSFREAFSPDPPVESFLHEHGVDPRQWFSQSLVKGELIELPADAPLPFSVKPDRKFTIMDVVNIMRSHGHIEGQRPDIEKGYRLGLSDNETPHQQGGKGNICHGRTQELVVYQLRNWMPTKIGSLAWRTLAAPCGSVLVPWYSGITEVPKPYHKQWDIEEALKINFHFDPPKGTFEYDPENAFDVFKRLENIIDLNYTENIVKVRNEWDSFEHDQFDLQPSIEKVAMELIKEDMELAEKFLTGYSGYRAMKALEKAKNLVNYFNNGH